MKHGVHCNNKKMWTTKTMWTMWTTKTMWTMWKSELERTLLFQPISHLRSLVKNDEQINMTQLPTGHSPLSTLHTLHSPLSTLSTLSTTPQVQDHNLYSSPILINGYYCRPRAHCEPPP